MLNIAAGNPVTGYNLSRSLRFRSSASAYLNRTYVASPTDYRKYTFSAWVKLGALGVSRRLIDAGSGSDTGLLNFNADGTLEFSIVVSGSGTTYLKTNNLLRDPSAWYHIVFSCDTSVSSNQFKFYVNSVQASYSTNTAITINYGTYLNSGSSVAQLGRSATYAQYFDGYLAEVNFIDGQALTPTSFGSYSSTTGVWQPARYSGTYGTNGFYLPFTDNSALTTSSNVGLGKDFSGNGNYWTTNNISITSGATYDSMTDVPTLTSATAANYCVGNPLSLGSNASLSNANLSGTLTGSGGWSATICGLTSGKWYYETTMTANSGNSAWVGFLSDAYTKNDNAWSYSTQTALYANDGRNGNNASYGATWTTNDVIGIAIDLSTSSGSITFYKNGVSQGVMFSSLTSSAVWRPLISGGGTGTTIAMNFGQRPFAYTPPTGYVALNTYNLPTSTIVKGNTVMDATTYSGNGTTLSVVNAAGFKPDLVWYKARSFAYDNSLFDSVRGASNQLVSNLTQAETSLSGVTAFNSNGFTLGSSVNGNNGTSTYVAWQWQAGQGTTSSNTSGSITSSVSVNASAGFSVVTYTGTGVAATVGHGLGVAPSWIIVKARSAVQDWRVYTVTVGNTGVINLNDTGAAVTGQSGFWNNTSPTSSVFSLGTAASTNGSGTTYVAYCWTPIAGYSAFGSYTGNGSADGPFVYLGFRPRWILLKRSTDVTNWRILDTARDAYNIESAELYPNTSSAESSFAALDGLSNGFKIRNTDAGYNASGGTYIYAAFAENPFKNSLAR